MNNSEINQSNKVYIAGHTGMVGSAILNCLKTANYSNIIFRTSKELDLTDGQATEMFFKSERPDIVILCAAKVGGIQANINRPATFLLDNLMIQNNVINSAWTNGTKKLIFLGSSCIYPKDAPQPLKEEYLLTGKLEPTNEGYAIAKIAGLKLLEGFRKQYGFNSINLMPCNLYGPNDSFDPENSHVLSALVRKFVDAVEEDLPELTLWGTGIAKREFMHVTDMAQATKFMMENYEGADFVNIGTGFDISISDLAALIADFTNFKGKIKWDSTKPDGMLRKCMDVSRMEAAGFSPKISLNQGVQEMINIYKNIKLNK